MNRREIIRTGSLGTLGLLAAQTFPSARAQARVAGANERIRIGIVGFSDRLNSSLLPDTRAHGMAEPLTYCSKSASRFASALR